MKSIALPAVLALTIPVAALADGASMTIVDVASEAGQFTTLLQAAEAAGLAETLAGDGPFTVFAPTDAAFEDVPADELQSLLQPENRDRLAELLQYHVVPGAVMSGDLSDGMTPETVEGGELTIDLDDGVMVNDATVVQADVEASNGVIHIIDTVLFKERWEDG